jgi:hypothetical protein
MSANSLEPSLTVSLDASDDCDGQRGTPDRTRAPELRALPAPETVTPVTSTDALSIARSVWGDDLVEPATPS